MQYINMEKTGIRLREKMKGTDIPIREWVKIIGISEQAIYRWFRGETLPTLDNLMVLTDKLGCKVEDLIIRNEK